MYESVRTDNFISKVLLCAFACAREKSADCTSREGLADATSTRLSELLKDSRVLLTESTRVEVHGFVVALHPAIATQDRFGECQGRDENEGNERFREVHVE